MGPFCSAMIDTVIIQMICHTFAMGSVICALKASNPIAEHVNEIGRLLCNGLHRNPSTVDIHSQAIIKTISNSNALKIVSSTHTTSLILTVMPGHGTAPNTMLTLTYVEQLRLTNSSAGLTQVTILHLHEAQWLDFHGQPTAARLVHEIWRHWAPSLTTSFTHSDFLQRIMAHLAALRSNSSKGKRVDFECIQ
ncbi:hypothetical protein TRVL_10057 [Trypanosoma vivax]|nr:hypothetical protein TRVL_10057 [Trypanosoma vivax]